MFQPSPASFSALLDQMREAVILVDPDGRVEVWSRGAERMFGWTEAEVVGRDVRPLIAPELSDDEFDALRRAALASGGVQQTARRRRKDGAEITTALSISPLLNASGQLSGLLAVSREATDTERLTAALQGRYEELERLHKDLLQAQRDLIRAASTDALTGVANRRAILDAAQEELQRAHRTRRPMCLALLDVDHFKRFNDRYGHATGDLVLSIVAKAIVDNLRQYDHVGRYGGEEFCLVLPEATEDAGLAILERVGEVVGITALPCADEAYVTLSAGLVSTETASSPDLNALLRAADVALYRSKANGRTQVTVAEPADFAAR
jgi:diguanylate cyclase (GGDEF)-like protein/PAS domain S-box-containing protein